MAVNKTCFRPMEVYWTRDNDSEDGTEDTGLFSAGNHRPRRPKCRGKKTHEVRAAIPKRQPVVQDLSPKKSFPSSQEDVTVKKAALKDLCAEDKKRVANLIKELARTGEEKEVAIKQLQSERSEFEAQLKEVCEQQAAILAEREGVQKQLIECQRLLGQYQACLSDQHKTEIQMKNYVPPERRAELYTPEKQKPSQSVTERTPLPCPDPAVIAHAGTKLHTPHEEYHSIEESTSQQLDESLNLAGESSSPPRPFTQMIDQLIAEERAAIPPGDKKWTTPQAVQEKLFGMGPLPAPVLSSTQKSDSNQHFNIHTQQELSKEQFKPLPIDPKSLNFDNLPPQHSDTQVGFTQGPRKNSSQPEAAVLYSLDDSQFLEYYSKLGPEERRHQVALQREALLAEQARLRTILADQEALLKSKQEALHNQQELHLQRLRHFEETGTFPLHNIAQAYLKGKGREVAQSGNKVKSGEEEGMAPDRTPVSDVERHSHLPSLQHEDFQVSKTAALPQAFNNNDNDGYMKSAATSPVRPLQRVNAATSPLRQAPEESHDHNPRSTDSSCKARKTGKYRKGDSETDQIIKLMAEFSPSSRDKVPNKTTNQNRKQGPKLAAKAVHSKHTQSKQTKRRNRGPTRHEDFLSQSDDELEESQILEDIFFV